MIDRMYIAYVDTKVSKLLKNLLTCKTGDLTVLRYDMYSFENAFIASLQFYIDERMLSI